MTSLIDNRGVNRHGDRAADTVPTYTDASTQWTGIFSGPNAPVSTIACQILRIVVPVS